MTVAYPIDRLPYPVRDSFSQQYGNGFTVTQMDDYHRRPRRRFEMLPQNNSITWRFTWDEFNIWEGFLRYDCAQASGYFTMALFPAAPTYTYRLTAYPQSSFDEATNSFTVTGTVERIRVAPNVPAKTGVLPVWPTTLPLWEKSGYQINRDDTVSRSSISYGLASQLARFKEEVAVVAATLLLSKAELNIFDAYVHDTLIGGLAPFSGYFSNGTGTTLQRLNFIEAPKIESSGAAFKVTVSMEIRDIPVISELDYRGENQLTFSDTLTYSESIKFRISRTLTDSLTFSESINHFNITKAISDSLSYSESVSLVHTGYTGLTDGLGYSESVAFAITRAPIIDTVSFTASGGIIYNPYIQAAYIQMGYIGVTVPFTN